MHFSKTISRINRVLNSSNFIEALGILFWLLLIVSIISIVIISFNKNLIFTPTIEGFNNIFEIYKFPLALLASSVAILTLRVTFIRVTQTDKQLESSYKPELYIEKAELFFYTRKDGEYANKFVFSTSGMFNELPNLKIFNVGFAVAKEIKHHFEYDIDKAIRVLSELVMEEEFRIKFLEGTLEITSEKTNYRTKLHNVAVQNRERISNFLLPTSDSRIFDEINLPIYYCELFALFLYLQLRLSISEKNKIITKKDINVNSFPWLNVIITYNDLGGKTLRKLFEIRFNVPFFAQPIVDGIIVDRDNKFLINPVEILQP